MGTGSAAVLGLWLWRQRGCAVTCTDVQLDVARKARAAILSNGAPLHVICCRLLRGLRGDFDIILFNPPYVPTGTGRRRGLPESYRCQWDGGPAGVDTIAAFLQAFEHEGGRATALLGVNHRHVPRARIDPLLHGCPGVIVQEIWRHPWLPVDVYVLARRKSPTASMSSPEE